MKKRLLSLALCLCMLAGVFPFSSMTYAAEQDCSHIHGDDCGYVEAKAGQPCTFAHTHDDTCGYEEAVEAAPCSVEAEHVHDDTCGGDPENPETLGGVHLYPCAR